MDSYSSTCADLRSCAKGHSLREVEKTATADPVILRCADCGLAVHASGAYEAGSAEAARTLPR